jgi:cysteine-rich repeat protein
MVPSLTDDLALHMTSHRVPAPLLLLCTFATACYSPHDEVTSGGADEQGGSSESDAGNNPVTAPTSTVNSSEPTSSPTGESDDTGPGTSVDSTGDSGAPVVCGDGMVEGDEVCDDGVNDGSYDGCVADCTARGPHCGDGEEQADEVCDDGDQTNGNGTCQQV